LLRVANGWHALGGVSHPLCRIELMFVSSSIERPRSTYHGCVAAVDWEDFRYDDRGESLAWRSVRVRLSTGVVLDGVAIDGPSWILDHLRPSLERVGAQAVKLKSQPERWAYALADGLDPELVAFLDLLADVKTVNRCAPELGHCIALDLYKRPDDGDPMQWPNTEAGDLVHRYKYRGEVSAGRALRDRMAAVIRSHPLLASCSAVISVPGHDTRQLSPGERLAQAVASRVEIPFFPTEAVYETRLPAKEGNPLEPSAVRVSPELFLADRVIIVDDVMRSGSSLRAIAKAARAAGAVEVHAVCCGEDVEELNDAHAYREARCCDCAHLANPAEERS
jgi:predicted amidophosphoribosyltransferase